MDVVGGFLLADGRRAKALTGVDDHSRFCVERLSDGAGDRRSGSVTGSALAMRSYGVPEEILTDNGKVFTGRFNRPPVEVLFDRVCRENGITHRLTQPRSPTTTGQDRAVPPHPACRVPHRPGLRRPGRAQAELDAWVDEYNHRRPHSAIGMVPPVERFTRRTEPSRSPAPIRG